MEISVVNLLGEEIDKYLISDGNLDKKGVSEHSKYLVKKYQDSYYRYSTASVKNRATITGGGAKPYKQKGTGRARRGTSRSPLIRHGAVIFGPQPRNFKIKINKKVVRSVVKSVIVEKSNNVKVLKYDESKEQIKTKVIEKLIKEWNNVTIIINNGEHNINKASRNLKKVKMMNPSFVSINNILIADQIIITEKAMKNMEESILK
jgi:large subunit ribosomal protein L4